MSESDFESVQKAITAYVQANPGLTFNALSEQVRKELKAHARDGVLSLGPDKNLVGDELEIRVRSLLEDAGFDVQIGRGGLEDLIVKIPDNAETKKPLVVEIKSNRKPTVARDDLRQLDDWVFDLSGEEQARKRGLGGGFDALSLATDGLITDTHYHPSPHKGVLIFNAPVGVSFSDRPKNLIGDEELRFAKKRGFCIIPLSTLVNWVHSLAGGDVDLAAFWERVHHCEGVLEWRL